MRTRRSPRSGVAVLQIGRGVLLASLTLWTQAGCTREFYREWANQDVSEAIFEKSRDPRWRLDTFSVEPPALSRFADPYDPDVPPAPPDDVASEALSPVPQWPDNRLMMPAEGTGYLDLLESWQRQDLAQAAATPARPLDDTAFPPERTIDPAPYPPGLQPPGWASGGVPVSPSSDPASRPSVPFEPYPGMANPFAPGTVIGPEVAGGAAAPPPSGPMAQPQPQPPVPSPGAGGAGTAGRPPMPRAVRPGMGIPPGGIPRLSPGTPPSGPTPLSPGTPPSTPPPVSPGTPPNVPGAPSPGSPTTAIDPRRHPAREARPVLQIVRLQDDRAWAEAPSPRPASAPALPVLNSGTNIQAATPISVSSLRSAAVRLQFPSPGAASNRQTAQTDGARGVRDTSIARVAFQEPGGPAPVPPPPGGASSPATTQPPDLANPPGAGPPATTQPPTLPNPLPEQPPGPPGTMDPNVQTIPALPGQPPLDRRRLDEIGRMPPSEAVGLAGILVPTVPPMNESEAAGLPRNYKAYKVNMQQAWLLTLMNGRFYQFQLEQLYLSALPVTLQRFAFEPQFYAGLSPRTGVPQTAGPGSNSGSIGGGSFPGTFPTNTFTYATRFSPTGQVSTLNLGTVAGFGKLFSSGGQLLMGFANQLVFNFAGNNPRQPTVLSSLPLSFVQPLLRGGGRAVTLEPLTLAERSLLYQVRSFAKFRQEFLVATLTGGQIQNFGQGFSLAGFSTGGNSDPTVGFIPAAFNVVQVEIDRRNVAFYENLVRLYQELIQGEASGLSQLQVDQVTSQLIRARQNLFTDKVAYRVSLDQFKMQMGLPPDVTIILDQNFLGEPFYRVFNLVDAWQKDPERQLTQLPGIIGQIPELQDIDIDGRSALGLYRNYSAKREFVPENEDGLEDLLQSAVRIALEYRLDLMNARANLYDSWRQIRVIANTLQGILNVSLTNQVFTAPNTTNPLAFLSQAKNFSLVLNAELPLVRMNERNQFRQALINYQRQRRTLMNTEDNIKIQLRSDLRNVHVSYINYEINKRTYELNVRLKDQAFEQIVAPPAGGSQGLAQSANAATQTTNLLSFQNATFGSQSGLITAYQSYQTNRLIFYRDIGTLPYDEWEAFSELFPSEYRGTLIGNAAGRPGLTPGPEAAPPPGVGR